MVGRVMNMERRIMLWTYLRVEGGVMGVKISRNGDGDGGDRWISAYDTAPSLSRRGPLQQSLQWPSSREGFFSCGFFLLTR